MSTRTIGQLFQCYYPASNGEGLTFRHGMIETLRDDSITLAVDGGYRTFKLAKMVAVGDIVSIRKSGQVIAERFHVRSLSDHAIWVSAEPKTHNRKDMLAFTVPDCDIIKHTN